MAKAPTKKPDPNNIAFLRRSALIGAERAGQMLGKTKSTWVRFETGELDWTPYRKEIAKIVRAKPKDLDDPNLQKAAVPVTCWVKNKSYIYDNPPRKLLEQVRAFEGAPRTTHACVVRNPDHPVYPSGCILYFDSNPTTSPSRFLNRECIVTIEKSTRGNRLLAWVGQGSAHGKYTLYLHKEPVEVDVKIVSAHPVLKAVKP